MIYTLLNSLKQAIYTNILGPLLYKGKSIIKLAQILGLGLVPLLVLYIYIARARRHNLHVCECGPTGPHSWCSVSLVEYNTLLQSLFETNQYPYVLSRSHQQPQHL